MDIGWRRLPGLMMDPLTLGEQHLKFWTSRLDSPSFVYFIRAGGKSDPVKIGLAINPIKRLASLQTGNATRLRIIYVVPGHRQHEADYHRELASERMSGEWFKGPKTNAVLNRVRELTTRQVKQYAGNGRFPLPAQTDETLELWRRIADAWISGIAPGAIGAYLDVPQASVNEAIPIMRRDGGYELAPGLTLRQGDVDIRRTGNFRKLNAA